MPNQNQHEKAEGDISSELHDILYEIEMFLFPLDSDNKLGNKLKLIDDQKLLGDLKRTLLESQLLHARGLLDFLRTENPLQPDDAALKDFGIQGTLVSKDDTENLKTRLNKTLAHITTVRLGYRQQKWLPDDLLPVLQGCLKFLEHLENKPPRQCPETNVKIRDLADGIRHQLSQKNGAGKITFSSIAAETTAAGKPVDPSPVRPPKT